MTRRLLALTLGVALAGTATVALAGRDSSGTMSMTSVAGGYPFVSGQTISSSGMNANFAEVVSELSDSASRSGKGGFTAPVRGANGTAALPSFSFTSDTNTGLYRVGTDSLGVSAGGSLRLTIDTTGALFADPVSFAGSTTTTGRARLPGGVYGATTFNNAVTFVSSVVVPTPVIGADVANKAYVDAAEVTTTAITAGTDWAYTINSVRKRAGVIDVYFDAAATVGSAVWTSVGTLPAGWRPSQTLEFLSRCDDGAAVLSCVYRVSTAGVISVPYYITSPLTDIWIIGTGDKARGHFTFIP